MSTQHTYRPATVALHGGHQPDAASRARAVPIYQTTSYVFESADHAADVFALKTPANIYTRITNPTTAVLEERLAQLDGGVGALAVASGQAAITLAVLNIARAGQNIVATRALYGGTYNLFRHTLARFGIETRFVDSSNVEEVEAAIDGHTRLVYTESIGNPKNNVDDFEALADVAHRHGVPFVVDNTVSPFIFRPFDHGADVIVYSLTKFIGGHGTSIGGAIVDSGRFNWANGRFPEFTEPDPSYHGLVFCDDPRALVHREGARPAAARPRPVPLAVQRVPVHPGTGNAARCGSRPTAATRWRSPSGSTATPHVAWVNHPLLPDHPDHERAKKYFPNGAGAIVGFGIRGGLEAGKRVIDAVRLFSHLANIGDAKSLIIHPASTTHQQLTPEERVASGVTDDYLRLSIGIEDIEDVIDDLEQAILASQQTEVEPKPLLLVG